MSLLSLPPFHLVTFSTLFGTTTFQSFIAGPVAFSAIPRPAFAQLQTAITPVFFGIQTALVPILALTYPTERTAISQLPFGLAGIFHPENRWAVLTPFTLMFFSGLVNLVYLGPQTTKVMKQRKGQEHKDGKKAYDAGPHSPEMERLNKRFSTLHGASSLVDLMGWMAMVGYCWVLGEKFF